jgi:hypothetical protein
MTYNQRPPQLGDFTVCQDKETVQDSIIVNNLDSINRLNELDWAISDFKNGGETPYIYVPNRVYAMDTCLMKDTLEGLMPIPENLDGNCRFETASNAILTQPTQTSNYRCGNPCPVTNVKHCYSGNKIFYGGPCPEPGNTSVPMGVLVYGLETFIIFRVQAKSAFEFLDIRITNFLQHGELDAIGWPPGESPGENFTYTSLGNNVYRIWAFPGGGRNGKFGPAGTDVKIKVFFTVGGGLGNPNLFGSDFPGWNKEVTVSYVGAGRRGNHR